MYQGKKQFDELQSETLRKTTNQVERHKVCVYTSKKFGQTDQGKSHEMKFSLVFFWKYN